MMARKPFIASYWKTAPMTVDEAKSRASAVVKSSAGSPTDVSRANALAMHDMQNRLEYHMECFEDDERASIDSC